MYVLCFQISKDADASSRMAQQWTHSRLGWNERQHARCNDHVTRLTHATAECCSDGLVYHFSEDIPPTCPACSEMWTEVAYSRYMSGRYRPGREYWYSYPPEKELWKWKELPKRKRPISRIMAHTYMITYNGTWCHRNNTCEIQLHRQLTLEITTYTL